MLDGLQQAVKEAAALDLAAVSDAEIAELVVDLERAKRMLEAAQARAAAACDTRRISAADGAKSTAAWLAVRTGSPKQECSSLVRLGRRLRSMPVVAAAWETGDISTAHVRRLAGACNRRSAAEFRRDEALLVDKARELPFSAFAQVVDYWSLYADPDGADEADIDRRERRGVSFDRTVGGMWSGSMLLDPIGGEIVAAELERLEQELFESDWAEAKAAAGRDPFPAELRRTGAQRRADALIEMARRSSRPSAGAAAKPLFSVVLGSAAFAHLCETAWGQVVSPKALVPYLSEADLERHLFDSAGERVISVSRRRSFDGALRRLIEVRDRLCYHPTCDEPAHRCQADHVVPYSAGGMTSQSNGRLACGFHNRLRNRRGPPIRRRE